MRHAQGGNYQGDLAGVAFGDIDGPESAIHQQHRVPVALLRLFRHASHGGLIV
jgi:hypothetical protein